MNLPHLVATPIFCMQAFPQSENKSRKTCETPGICRRRCCCHMSYFFVFENTY